jgi:hypothetical protein
MENFVNIVKKGKLMIKYLVIGAFYFSKFILYSYKLRVTSLQEKEEWSEAVTTTNCYFCYLFKF